MNFSVIQKSQLEGAHRLDAEYYQPEYLSAMAHLKKSEHITIGDIAFVTDGEHGSPVYDEQSGIKYFSGQFVSDGYLTHDGIHNIDEKINNKNKRSQLKEGNILLSIVGTIGKVGIIQQADLPGNTDRNVATIKINNNNYYPEFITTFLLSKFGLFQTQREAAGNVQPIIILSKIRDLVVPIVAQNNQQEVVLIFKNYLKLVQNASDLYSQAENLLLNELGLKDKKFDEDLATMVKFSQIKSAGRMDADYFQPKYVALVKTLGKFSTEKLSDICVIRRGSLIAPQFYDETSGTPYIRGRDFSNGDLEKGSLVYINNTFVPKNETSLQGGDIVFASIGSVGKLAVANDEWNKSFISNNTARLRIRDRDRVNPEYLGIVLKSIVGQFQFDKEMSRTAQPKISDSQVASFIIPILSKPIQQKIADLVRQSHEARKKSKQLLQEAKRKVEEMIEQGIINHS